MKKKKVIIIVFVITILVASVSYFVAPNLISRFYEQNPKREISTKEDFPLKEPFVYVGDYGYGFVLKGKLLKKEFEKDYKKLPDTLYKMEFNDYLYPIDINAEYDNMRYSLIEYNTIANISNYQGNYQQEQLISYLKLAIKGIVEFPIFSQLDYTYNALVTNEEFNNIFKTYFVVSENNYGLSKLPYEIKKSIIAFYASEEGKYYRYKIKGQQTSNDLIWEGELTGEGKKEFAILFYNRTSDLEDQSMLLVFATKSFSGKNRQYYLVYSEMFYHRIVLDHLKKSSDGIDDVRKAYIGKSIQEESQFDGILIKQINRPDEVLVYNQEFDKMVNYPQYIDYKIIDVESGEEIQEVSE